MEEAPLSSAPTLTFIFPDVQNAVVIDSEVLNVCAGAPSAHRSQSVESLEEDAYRRLQFERSTWHNDLDNLVQGGFASEDTELAITLARCASLSKSIRGSVWVCTQKPLCALQSMPSSACPGIDAAARHSHCPACSGFSFLGILKLLHNTEPSPFFG